MKHAALIPLTVVARSPFHIYYEGPATTVTATNLVGTFDILPGHADFFSMLSPGRVIIDPSAPLDSNNKAGTEPDQISFDITNGIVAVRDNRVMLFVNM